MCTDGVCISDGTEETGSTNAEMSADESNSAENSSGDGDGDATGDGDASGDGDGDASGDGDTSGDGDGDATGDGDGDGDTSGGIYCGSDTPIITFSEIISTDTEPTYYPFALKIGDVAGDNSMEIVVGGADFLGVGSGRVQVFQQTPEDDGLDPVAIFDWDAADLPDPPIGPDDKEFSDFLIHDLDEDFDPELVILSRESMHWYTHGDPDIQLQGELVVSTRLMGPVVGDFYGGGPDDIFFVHEPAGWEGSYVDVTQGGSIELIDPAPSFLMGGRMTTGRSADLAGNSRPDIVLLETGSDNGVGDEIFSVLLNDQPAGNATFVRTDYDPQDDQPAELELFDVDGDTTIDIVLTTTGPDVTNPLDPPGKWAGTASNEGIHIFTNDGTGAFTHAQSILIADRMAGLASADFNCDGETDLIAGNYHGDVFFLAGDGAGNFADPVTVFAATGIAGVIETYDLNQDGRPDIVWPDVLGRKIRVAYQD